ncbi:MAG: hypothetical protein ACO24P_00035 [Candidatus Nanopelagicaceae bacterium]
MDHFQFSSIKLLQLKSTDSPEFSLLDGQLTITATRDGSKIMIQAPVKNTHEIKELTGITDKIVPLSGMSVQHKRKPRRRLRSTAAIRRGEEHPFSRLTETQVRQIKERLSSPLYMREFNSQLAAWTEMAKEYGVSMACISHIHGNRTWKHVQV